MTGDWNVNPPSNDEEPIDRLLTAWARDRDVEVGPDAARLAADRALAEIHAAPQRRWMPAAIFGGSVAAALGGVLLLSPADDPSGSGAPGAAPGVELASSSSSSAPAPGAVDDGLPRFVGTEAALAALPEDLPDLDDPTDDALMASYVFTLGPAEEPIY
ncbi:hypothetical protein B5C34_04665 [Pacificimonas flava]|uniref:Uncharacterized protein n=2 Tax=Pacificimonas TaxID=1960290 RepID=A0A219B3V4_9SPHN|nr:MULTISPECIES: hypothetical protein [Pacificimonas]MBZ6377490.1 hypothetical protein [Pacificimonas aurantium]OWV32813.1 hypothetical protein B5C34_04665 [Pacificimonas flava]